MLKLQYTLRASISRLQALSGKVWREMGRRGAGEWVIDGGRDGERKRERRKGKEEEGERQR